MHPAGGHLCILQLKLNLRHHCHLVTPRIPCPTRVTGASMLTSESHTLLANSQSLMHYFSDNWVPCTPLLTSRNICTLLRAPHVPCTPLVTRNVSCTSMLTPRVQCVCPLLTPRVTGTSLLTSESHTFLANFQSLMYSLTA